MKQDLLWESACMAIYGELKPTLTTSERGRLNKGLRELREIGATPSDITARAKQYSRVMPPGCLLTITGLVSNWARCVPAKKTSHASHQEWPGLQGD